MFTDRDRFSTFTIRRSWGSGRGVMIAAGLGLLLVLLAGLFALDPEPVGAQDPTPSTDATLSQWEWRRDTGWFNGDYCWPSNRGAITNPTPGFNAATTAYSTTVTAFTSYIAVKAKASDENATIAFSRGDPTGSPTPVTARDAVHGFGDSQTKSTGPPWCLGKRGNQNVVGIKYAGPISLDTGDTTINVTVTAEDGATTKTYTLNVTRGVLVTLSVDGPQESHESLDYSSGVGAVVEEGGAFTIRASLNGRAPSSIRIDTRVWLRGSNTDQVHRGNAEFGDLGAGNTKHRIAHPEGWYYATFGRLTFSTGDQEDKTIVVTVPEDADTETDAFVIEFELRQTQLVQAVHTYPTAGVIIREKHQLNSGQQVSGGSAETAVDMPGPVRNLSVRQVQPTRIRVEWEAPEDGGAVGKYQVTLMRDGEELSKRRPGAKKRYVVIRKLEPGATYTVSVRAKNVGGQGAEATAQITLAAEEAQ
ncbi:MAG: fibronectin type III domain-containing protein [Chloroflexi bacterium]|nr:fibronectin type III domain-containing protein [Chloroflexota bacterium]